MLFAGDGRHVSTGRASGDGLRDTGMPGRSLRGVAAAKTLAERLGRDLFLSAPAI